jgi:hypothetical protein
MFDFPEATVFHFHALTLLMAWGNRRFGIAVTLPYVILASQVTSWLDWAVLTVLMLAFGFWQKLEVAISG